MAKNIQRKIGFTSTTTETISTASTTTKGQISFQQWETVLKGELPKVKRFLKIYFKFLKAIFILYFVGMGITFGLALVETLLPAMAEKMPQLFKFVEEFMIPYYERVFRLAIAHFTPTF